MKWKNSLDTYVWIFNVGRGLSILIRTPNNHAILYDLGSSDEFSPLDFINENILPHITEFDYNNQSFNIAQTILSHPHHDHISEVDKFVNFTTSFLTCPNHKIEEEKFDFSTIESTEKLKVYKELYSSRGSGLQIIPSLFDNVNLDGLQYGIYYVRPPKIKELYKKDDHKYGNGCSLVLYYKHGKNSILIPGDITPEAIDLILESDISVEKRFSIITNNPNEENWHKENSDQPTLKSLLESQGLSVLITPHHGLESCYSSKLANLVKPQINVISEKRTTANEGTVDNRYQNQDASHGFNVIFDETVEFRNSISTKTNESYLIKFCRDNNMEIYGSKDPLNLLNK